MKKEISTSKLNHLYKPKTINQEKYLNSLYNRNNSIIVSSGPAGTGKTMFACFTAIEMFKKQEIKKIVLTRPIVTVEEDIGFLPGNLVKKMDPWTKPLFDIFSEYYSTSEINNMIQNGNIEIVPLVFMRGRTFKDAFIIADEMQNSTPNQMLMLLTRVGTNSKLVITGDLNQTDKLENNGLKDLIHKYREFQKYNKNDTHDNNIKLIFLNETDIQRSKVVEKVLNIYNFIVPPLIVEDKKSIQNTTISSIQNNTVKKTDTNFVIEKNVTIERNIKNGNKKFFVRNYSDDYDAALIPKHQYKTFFDSL